MTHRKIQLTIANNSISFIDNDVEHEMRSKSDKIEIMINYKTVIKEVFIHLKVDIKII